MVHGRARIYIDEAFAYLRFGMVQWLYSLVWWMDSPIGHRSNPSGACICMSICMGTCRNASFMSGTFLFDPCSAKFLQQSVIKTVAQLGVVMTLATELAVANTNGQL